MRLLLIIWTLDCAYSRAENRKEAVKAFKQSLFLNPDFDEAHFNLAAVYLAKNDRDSALQHYSRLKILNANLANKLYLTMFSDKILPVNDK